MIYDFIEVGGGAGVVTAALREKGMVCLNLDLSLSKEFVLHTDTQLRWLYFLL